MQFPAEVILLVVGILALVFSTASLVAAVLAADRSKRIPDIEKQSTEGFARVAVSLTELKASLAGMETVMTDFISELLVNEAPMPIFRSLDGKHTADSVEELMSKMMSDPDGPKMTEEDIEKLKEFFEQATDDIEDDDDDDDDEPTEGWKKGK